MEPQTIQISLSIIFVILFIVNVIIVNLLNWWARTINEYEIEDGFAVFFYVITYMAYIVANFIFIIHIL